MKDARFSLAAYKLLIRTYPKSFRERFGREMERSFASALYRTPPGYRRLALWLTTLSDVVRTVGLEHWDEWIHGMGGGGMDGWIEDARRGVRGLLRDSGFTLTIVLTLGLGIGATAALFSVVDGVLLTPMPYAQADRIVSLNEEIEDQESEAVSVSYRNGADWRDRNESFQALAHFRAGTLTLTGRDQAVNLAVLFVDPAYFDILGATVAVGRFPGADENVVPGGHALAVLSYRSWQDLFGGSRDVLGSGIELSGQPYTVVGVMAEEHVEPFPSQSGGSTDLWVPAMMAGQVDPRGNAVLESRRVRTFGMLGLLAPGRTAESAEADLDQIADRLEEAYPGENRGLGVEVTPLASVLTEDIRDTVLLLLVGAVVLLAIACFNVVNLLLVRGSTRRSEIAVQLALGAPRERIVRLLLVESLMLAGLGGLLGVVLAFLGLPLLLGLVPNQLPATAPVGIDGSVLLAMLALTTLVGAAVGLVPALRATRVDPGRSMTSARGGVGDRVAQRLRSSLVVAELSTATVLLVGTLLLLRGFTAVTASDPGFETERVLTARVTLAPARYPDLEALAVATEQLAARVQALPEVEWARPWGPGRPGQTGFLQSSIPDGLRVQAIVEAPLSRRQHVGAGTLDAMGIRILQGRGISPDDRMDTERVAVIGESMAAELWPDQNPLGQIFRGFTPEGEPHDPSRTWVVVGVAADAQHEGRLPLAGGISTKNDAYFPIAQRPERSFTLVVRTREAPDVAPIRRAIADFDPDVPVFAVATMAELFDEEEAPARLAAVLMTIFGLAALALAGLGVYGVISFAVTQQRREIGLRTALGATRGRVLRAFLGRGVRLAGLGFGMGGTLAVFLAGSVQSLGAVPVEFDAVIVVVVGVVLAGIALLACLVPAVAATRVAPAVVLSE